MAPEKSVGWVPTFLIIFSHQSVSQRVVRTALEKQLDPMGPIASRGVSVPEFLRKPRATCDFSMGVWTPLSPALDPPMIHTLLSKRYSTCTCRWYMYLVLVLLCSLWCPFKFCNQLAEEERAGRFSYCILAFVFACVQVSLSIGAIRQSIFCNFGISLSHLYSFVYQN